MRSFIKFLLWTAGVLGIIGLLLYLMVFDGWKVPDDDPTFSASLAPNMAPGDEVLLYKSGTLKAGYLARCADPDAPGRYVIGRIVAIESEGVEVENGLAIVQGKRTPSPRACEGTSMRHPVTGETVSLSCTVEDLGGNEHPILITREHAEGRVRSKVENGNFYLLSDNRYIHLDSRDYGQVKATTCQHLVFRLWSSAGFFDSAHRFNVLW
jgi:signal peptidase I